MRCTLLLCLALIAVLVFVSMLHAIARHRAAGGADESWRTSALSEYLWATVPWLMMGACAFPAVRRILALG
jgi:heme/copper-type cytochrome/quinol oxidase subunit 2